MTANNSGFVASLLHRESNMGIIKRLDTLLARIEFAILIGLVFLLILLSFGQVVLRNLFNEGLLWADTLARQLVLWVGFLGASLAAREQRHLAIDFIPHLVSSKTRRWLKAASCLAAGLISIFLAQASWHFVLFEQEGGSTLFGDIPTWWFQTILPYSLIVIAFRFLLAAVSHAFDGGKVDA